MRSDGQPVTGDFFDPVVHSQLLLEQLLELVMLELERHAGDPRAQAQLLALMLAGMLSAQGFPEITPRLVAAVQL